MVEYENRGRGTRARERDAIMRSTNLDSDLVILHAEGFRTFLEGSVEVEAPVLHYTDENRFRENERIGSPESS